MLCMCIHYINCTQKKVMYGGESFFQIQSWPDYRFIATSWVGIYALPRLCHVIKIQKRDNKRDWQLWNELPWQKYRKQNLENTKRETGCEMSYHDPGPPSWQRFDQSIWIKGLIIKRAQIWSNWISGQCVFLIFLCVWLLSALMRCMRGGLWRLERGIIRPERGGFYNGIRLEEW